MKVYAVIVTYNGMQWYDRCLLSLQRSDVQTHIIVIDNASTDSSVNYIKNKYPEIILIESKKNLGFAKANNIGIKYALEHEADFVFLLNQDAWLNQINTISVLIEQYRLNPEYAIFSPLQLYGAADKIEQEVTMHFARNASTDFDFISDLYFNRLKDVYDIQYACAVCWLLPINTIKNIGGFDPLFYHYGEDDNYIQRVKYFGYKIGICPKVSISHDIKTRAKEYRNNNLDWKKYLLINLGNINNELNLDTLLRKRLKILILQFLRINRKLFKATYTEYLYLKSIKSKLNNSRNQNKKRQANWL
jgi:GT2 family glycosyltransferase